MFSCCICFCLTAADIFQSRLFDTQRAVPASGYAASHKKKIKTAWPVWRRWDDVFPPDQTQRGPTPADAIWARGDDGKGKVTGRQSGSRRTHGSVYGRLMYGPDRRARADYLSSRGMWANLQKRLHSDVSWEENNHFQGERRISIISSLAWNVSSVKEAAAVATFRDVFCFYI